MAKVSVVKKPEVAPVVAPVRKTRGRRKPESGRRARRPIVQRMQRTVELMQKKSESAALQVSRWNGESTREQAIAYRALVGDMTKLVDSLTKIAGHIAYLSTSGFNPILAPGGRRALQAGQRVEIKEKWYEPRAFGVNSDLAIVSVEGRYLILKHAANPKASQITVLRSWVVPVEASDPVEPAAAADDDPPADDDAADDTEDGDAEGDPEVE